MTPIRPDRSFTPAEISAVENEQVVALHAREGASLWHRRDEAVAAPHFRLADLAQLDMRLQAHLDGSLVAGNDGWETAAAALEEGKPGAVFTAGILAFQSGNEPWVQRVVEAGVATPETTRALISALGWVPIERAAGPIKALLASDQWSRSCVGIAGAASHRKLPTGSVLPNALSTDDPILKARTLRVVGELGLVDFHLTTRANLRSKNPIVRFWAAWSNALLDGHRDALACLQNIAERGGPLAERAAQMAMRRLPPGDAKSWIKKLVRELGKKRIAILAAGAFADPDVIPFLIDQMKHPKLAKVAGESFSLITGARIPYEDLDGEPPESDGLAPTESPDEDAASSADLSLPWPNPGLIQQWWSARQGNFAKGNRYLLGQPITSESLRLALKDGYQRQRTAASIELAILKPGRPLFEVRAPSWRQQSML